MKSHIGNHQGASSAASLSFHSRFSPQRKLIPEAGLDLDLQASNPMSSVGGAAAVRAGLCDAEERDNTECPETSPANNLLGIQKQVA